MASLLLAAALLATGCAGLVSESAGTSPTPPTGSPPESPLSSSEERVIAATYNIHIGKSVDDQQINLGRIAAVIRAGGADVVALQEVDRHTARSGRVDQTAELMVLTGMAGVFGKSIDFQGGEYGLAILTTGDILEWRHWLHPAGTEAERRSCLMARIRTRSGAEFWVLNSHLGLHAEDRRSQIEALVQAAATLDGPVLIMGDFNEEARADSGGVTNALAAAGFEDAWLTAPRTGLADLESPETAAAFDGATFPSQAPARRIDYIWMRPGQGWRPSRAWVLRTLASDHLPVFAEFEVER
ncbi:MAG: endonuclease/exonuclease/phosphatase family protein [Candidatus Sumerlaeia bacterium]